MKVSTQQTEKLLKGSQAFSQLGFSMLLTRLKKNYANDSSLESLQKCTAEINTFLDKFKAIMSKDYAIIEKL